METKESLLTIGASLLSGYVATKAMEGVAMKLYKMEPDEVRNKEDEVRPGPPYNIAAKKTFSLLNIPLNEEQLKRAGMAFHYGLGIGWAPLYTILKNNSNFSSVLSGAITGASLSLIMDEGMTPALGLSAPNKKYPLTTHLRGFLAHLVYGAVVAGVYEAVDRIVKSNTKEV